MNVGLGMPELTVVSLIERDVESHLHGVTDLEIRINDSGDAVLYAVSRSGGMLSAFDISGSGTPRLSDHQSLPTDTEQVGFLTVDGDSYIATFSPQADSTRLFRLDSAGDLVGGAMQPSDGSGAMNSVVQMEVGNQTYLYAANAGTGTLDTFRIASGGAISQIDTGSGTLSATTVARAAPGANQYLLAVDTDGQTIRSYEVQSDGSLEQRDATGAMDGLGVAGVSAMEHVSLAGAHYVIVTARDSSSLSVLRMDANGSLTPVDHVIDDLNTRFQHVTTLETVSVGDRVFIIVGGADEGVSLFELLPGGRLLHHDTIPDGFGISLANVSAIAAHEEDGEVEIFVGSATESGVTQLSMDPGPVGETQVGNDGADTLTGGSAGEVLYGRGGNDRLEGRGGDDILMDGAGVDTLVGGGGADIFVLDADGVTDEIRGFVPGIDRIDLTAWPMLRSIDQIAFEQTSYGAILRYRGETLRVYSEDGQPLSRQEVLTEDVIALTRVPAVAPEDAPAGEEFTGNGQPNRIEGDGNDNRLDGRGGNDTLLGRAGDDILIGGAGGDVLNGGMGTDIASYEQAGTGVLVDMLFEDRNTGQASGDRLTEIEGLTGSAHADDLRGSHDANMINGGRGNDRLVGRQGADTLQGDGGNDTLHGEAGNDVLVGGAGRDVMNGGLGNDQIWAGAGDAGNDRADGGGGNDVIGGGDGNDTLIGGDGRDTLYGGDGADRLDGGAGNDVAWAGSWSDDIAGGGGNDTLGGGWGNDTIDAGTGHDMIYGGRGDGADRVMAGDGRDTVFTGDGNDTILGGGGNDVVFNGGGSDRVNGGAGNDTLWGGPGDDRLTGGAGADEFHFVAGNGDDTITDFESGTDAIVLEGTGMTYGALEMTDTATGVVVDYGGGTLSIDGVSSSDLGAGDFVFL